jgi:hypothetical protein
MRPRGTHGDVAAALLQAAQTLPGTVRDLAGRAQVGYATARYTVSRLVDRGELVVHAAGRPAVLAAPLPQQRDEGLTLEQVWARFALGATVGATCLGERPST